MNLPIYQQWKPWFIVLKTLIFASLFLTFWILVARYTQRLDRTLGILLPGWLSPIGLVFMVAGATVGLSCVAFFALQGGGTPAPFDPPREFVATGPYRYCRNPMYISLFLLFGGLGLYWQSLATVGLVVPLAVAVHILVVTHEEPVLRKRFGPSYIEYCQHVPRWIPKL